MFDRLVENAIDFLKVSLEDFENRPKYSVINFCSAVEIFFKARLIVEHWSLVVAKPETARSTTFQKGDFKSVTLDQSISRLQNIAGERFSEEAQATFTILREHRNKLMHFFNPEYSDTSDRQTLTQIESEQCRAWWHLRELLRFQWKKYFVGFDKQIEELDKLMHEHRKFLGEKFKFLKPDIQALIEAGNTIATCSACGFSAAQQTEDTPPIKDCKCLVCGSIDRYLYIPCSYCGKDQAYRGDGDITCTGCGENIGIDEIIERCTPEDFQKPPNEQCENLLAYCHYCDHPDPSVAKLGNEWVCLACLEPHFEPGYCDWCNEFITGDLEGSGYFGCAHCDGKRGWDDDD
jgi:hypothetical protein